MNINKSIKITVSRGDGIGPEIMDSVLKILKISGANLEIEEVDIYKYDKEYGYIISDEAWRSIEKNKIFLKSPTTTPQSSGHNSLNVTLRKRLGLYANIRPACKYDFIKNRINFPNFDIVTIRENTEDLYCGIEYQHNQTVFSSKKITSEQATRDIMRYGFEYARMHNRKKISCFTKDNILKLGDGLFHNIFTETAKNYPDIKTEHYIADIGFAELATNPENFDVLILQNLFGDIASDIIGKLSGSIGICGSANIGDKFALFEAIHGSAPDIAGRNIANPSGLLHAAMMMLSHIGQDHISDKIGKSLFKLLRSDFHTIDLCPNPKSCMNNLTTSEFTDQIIKNLEISNEIVNSNDLINYNDKRINLDKKSRDYTISSKINKILVGCDIYIDNIEGSFSKKLKDILDFKINNINIKLKNISSKGVVIKDTESSSFFESLNEEGYLCLRFIKSDKKLSLSQNQIIELTSYLISLDISIISIEMLNIFDGKKGYTNLYNE